MDNQANDQVEFIGVYRDEQTAQAAADAAVAAGAARASVRIGHAADEREELRAEMREESEHTIAGPGNVGPFTKEMSKGISAGVPIGTVIGALIGLGLGFLPWANIGLIARLVIGVVCGAAAGATVGFYGGGLAAKGPAEKLAAERGVTMRVIAPDHASAQVVARRLADHRPIRLDSDGRYEWNTVTTEEAESSDGIMQTLQQRVVQGEGDWSGAERRADDPQHTTHTTSER